MKIDIHNSEKTFTIDLFDEYDSNLQMSSMSRTTGYTCTACVDMLNKGMYTEVGIIPLELIGKNHSCYNHIIQYLKNRNIELKITRKNKFN